jgi:uncharacterized membrane protein
MLVKQVLALNLDTIYKPAEALGGQDAKLDTLVNPIIYNVLIISGIVAFITIIISGFTYITAAGDKGKTTQAQHMLNYGIIGLVLVVAAFMITRLLGSILGFKFF